MARLDFAERRLGAGTFVDRAAGADHKQRLEAIPGTVPSLLEPPPGCRFAARCKYAMDVCRQAMPPLKEVAPGHFVRCVL